MTPTREQVRDLLFDAPFGTLTDDNVVTATVGDVVDAVMALLAEAPQPKVLWRGETGDPNGQYTEHGLSFLDASPLLDVPAGTRVWIVVDPDSERAT